MTGEASGAAAAALPLVMIAAVARNGVIGAHDSLPWRLPGDLRHFKAATLGRPVIMGRRTFEAIGKPLPGRFTVVVSRSFSVSVPPGIVLAGTPEGAVADARILAARHGASEVMVAGGGAIYAALMGVADQLLITTVELEPAGDTVFPPIDPALWAEVERGPPRQGPNDEAPFSVVRYARRR